MQVTKAKNYLPLVDKYKPKNIDNVILTSQLRTKINKIIDKKYINNTMIVGDTGVGKTLLIKLLIKKILGDQYENGCMDLNTSSLRGLINLKTSLPHFCARQMTKLQNMNIPKIVLMDEADNITQKAQNLIANMMETYASDTIFIFTCNDSTKLIESIQSRCSIMVLPNIKIDTVVNTLTNICKSEYIKYTIPGLNLIAENCNGDLRATINLLDNIQNGFEFVNIANVTEMLYKPSSIEIKDIIKQCAEKELFSAYILIDTLRAKGYCSTDILLALIDVLKRVNIDEHVRIGYIDIITVYYAKISEGLDSELQMYGCISKLVLFE
jgi:replication factor C subunit 2/4